MRNKNLEHRVTVYKIKSHKLAADFPFLSMWQNAGVLVIYTFLRGNKMHMLNYVSVAVAQLICHLCYIN